jgi:hypothetical protein
MVYMCAALLQIGLCQPYDAQFASPIVHNLRTVMRLFISLLYTGRL